MDAQVAEASYVDVSTELNSSGNIQHKGGSLDANWTVTGAVKPLDPPNAYVVDPNDADRGAGAWIGNGAYSSWIAANPFDRTGNGLMTFTDTFDVATPSRLRSSAAPGRSMTQARFRLTAICFPRCQSRLVRLVTSMRSLRPRATL